MGTSMPLDHIIRKNITYCLPTNSVRDVARAMKEDNVGAVLIIEGGVPTGILTDRDITVRCVSAGLDANQTRAQEIMTRCVETVGLDQGIYDVAQKMKRAEVRRVAVIDSSGMAVGLLSFDDVFDLLTEELNDLRAAVHPHRPKIVNDAA